MLDSKFSKKFFNGIEEALALHTAKGLSRGWNKSRTEHMFGKKHRIYIPLDTSNFDPTNRKLSMVEETIKNFLQDSGWIADMMEGTAYKIGEENRKMRVGRAFKKVADDMKAGRIELHPFFDDFSRIDYILQKYAEEKAKRGDIGNPENLMVVISRHPYDVAGCSTGRGWGSCLNLGQKAWPKNKNYREEYKDRGINAKYIPTEIEAGTLVAYLIKKSDKNIQSPIARTLIKPFYRVDDNKGHITDGEATRYIYLHDDEYQEKTMEFMEGYRKKAIAFAFKRSIEDLFNDKDHNDIMFEIMMDNIDMSRYRDLVDKAHGDDPEEQMEAWDKITEMERERIINYVKRVTRLVHLRTGDIKEYFDFFKEILEKEQKSRKEKYYDTVRDIMMEYAMEEMEYKGYRNLDDYENDIQEIGLDGDDVYYATSGAVYGPAKESAINKPFVDTVRKWLRKVQGLPEQGSTYYLAPGVYLGDEKTYMIEF